MGDRSMPLRDQTFTVPSSPAVTSAVASWFQRSEMAAPVHAANFFSSRPALEMKRTDPGACEQQQPCLSRGCTQPHHTPARATAEPHQRYRPQRHAPSEQETAKVSAARWPTEGTQCMSVANESSAATFPSDSPSMLHMAMVASSLQVYSTLAGDQQHAVTASLSALGASSTRAGRVSSPTTRARGRQSSVRKFSSRWETSSFMVTTCHRCATRSHFTEWHPQALARPNSRHRGGSWSSSDSRLTKFKRAALITEFLNRKYKEPPKPAPLPHAAAS